MGAQGKISLAEYSSSVTGLPPGATSWGPSSGTFSGQCGQPGVAGSAGQGGCQEWGFQYLSHELGDPGDLSTPSLDLHLLTFGLSVSC